MSLLDDLLDANNALLKHAAKEARHALKTGQFLAQPDYLLKDHLFFKTYLTLREVEIRGLRLLHEITVLAQLLQREEAAREMEQQMERALKAQEQGNGKKTVILNKKDLKKQDKVVTRDRKLVQESIEDVVKFFLAQHESLVQTAQLFQQLDPGLKLLPGRADRSILKLYARAGGSQASLLKRVREEIMAAHPLDVADDLQEDRGPLRHYLTELSDARREFSGFLHAHFPMVGAL